MYIILLPTPFTNVLLLLLLLYKYNYLNEIIVAEKCIHIEYYTTAERVKTVNVTVICLLIEERYYKHCLAVRRLF